jgi:alpha-tubulin suppressor-like RCC1 family protein
VFGQLGNNALTNSTTPVDLTFSKSVISVKASATHTCAILLGGDVQCWGRNDYGQLGVAATTFADDNGTPMAVSSTPIGNTCSDGAVTALSLAYYTSCALTSQGHYQCWGSPANDRATSQNASASSCQGKSGLTLSPF